MRCLEKSDYRLLMIFDEEFLEKFFKGSKITDLSLQPPFKNWLLSLAHTGAIS